jgi:hypothetical protein
LIGDVTNAVVATGAAESCIKRAGLARGKGAKLFSRYGDGGLPVLSTSNALVGFVIGEDDMHTLVLPAEDLVRLNKFNFRTFPQGHASTNRVIIRPRSAKRLSASPA